MTDATGQAQDRLIKRVADETAEAVHEVYRPLLGAKEFEIFRLRRLRETHEARIEELEKELDLALAEVQREAA